MPAPAPAPPGRPVLLMRLGARWIGVPTGAVREVVAKGFVTRLPTAPPHVMGVALVHGRVVPVIRLEQLLGAIGEGPSAPTIPRLVVLAHDDAEAAIVVDETRSIVEIMPPSAPPAREGTLTAGELLWHEQPVTLLDVPALLGRALEE